MTYYKKLIMAAEALEDVQNDKKTKWGSEFDVELSSFILRIYNEADKVKKTEEI